jgi:hypothetical protein
MPIFWNFLTAEKSRYKEIYCVLISAYAKVFSINNLYTERTLKVCSDKPFVIFYANLEDSDFTVKTAFVFLGLDRIQNIFLTFLITYFKHVLHYLADLNFLGLEKRLACEQY